MEQEHMNPNNKTVFEGGQLEAINLYILKTRNVILVCHMMKELFPSQGVK